jgi:hypothetical protein
MDYSDFTGQDWLTLALILLGIAMFILFGLQKIAENIAYGWHAGRLKAFHEASDRSFERAKKG